MGGRICENPFAVLYGIAVEHVFFQKERLLMMFAQGQRGFGRLMKFEASRRGGALELDF